MCRWFSRITYAKSLSPRSFWRCRHESRMMSADSCRVKIGSQLLMVQVMKYGYSDSKNL